MVVATLAHAIVNAHLIVGVKAFSFGTFSTRASPWCRITDRSLAVVAARRDTFQIGAVKLADRSGIGGVKLAVEGWTQKPSRCDPDATVTFLP
jgi:hypothetical protein